MKVMIKNIPSVDGKEPAVSTVPGEILTEKDLKTKEAMLSLRVYAINKNGFPVSIGLSKGLKSRATSGEKAKEVNPSDLVAETRLDRLLDSL